MWLRHVARVIDSSASIWVLDRPRAISTRTSRWRGVSAPTPPAAPASPHLRGTAAGTPWATRRSRARGLSRDCPACTVRMASTSTWGSVSFRRNPLAPARRAPRT